MVFLWYRNLILLFCSDSHRIVFGSGSLGLTNVGAGYRLVAQQPDGVTISSLYKFVEHYRASIYKGTVPVLFKSETAPWK